MNWITWSPPWAPHVVGKYTERTVDEDGKPEEQRMEMECKKCGAVYKRVCTTGSVKVHIQKFAAIHLHSDPFGDKK